MFSCCPSVRRSVRPSVRPSVCLVVSCETCEDEIVKTNESILMPNGAEVFAMQVSA